MTVAVCDRAQKGEPYASLAVGDGNARRVIIMPEKVYPLLVDNVKRPMVFDPNSWYSGIFFVELKARDLGN